MNYKGIKDQLFLCKNCGIEFKFKGHSNYNIFCGIPCAKEFATKEAEKNFEEQYQKWLNGEDLGLKNPRVLIKKFVIKRDGYKCSRCNLTNWLGEEITLWCDHIDGDASNNRPLNFRLICPNCDSQSDTFGAKNYGKGRKSRGLSQYG